MSIPLNINGAVFEYPENFDENWGVQATGWAQAVTNGMLQRAGGNFPLIADANFGASFGLVSLYYKSHSSDIATNGVVRLAKSDTVEWRNNANSADNILSTNNLDQLLYNGTVVGSSGGVTSLTGTTNQVIVSSPTGAVTLSLPQSIATISSPTFSSLTLSGLTAHRALTTDGSDVLTSSATTDTELGFVSGVTSSIQSQINSTVTVANAALPKAGGSMSGAINMGSNKILALANGTVSTDAAAFGQIFTGFQSIVQSTTQTATTVTSSTYTITALATASMTMTNAAHRIKITVSGGSFRNSDPGTANAFMTIFRDGVNIGPANGFQTVAGGSGLQEIDVPVSIIYIDSPGDTSSHGYAIYIKNSNNSTSITFNVHTNLCTIILEEIV